MATIEEKKFRDATGQSWIVRLTVPGAFSDRVNRTREEIIFECESHKERWVLRRKGGPLPNTDAEMELLLQKARREGSSL